MSIGNTKDQGNKGNNFPFQKAVLVVLDKIRELILGSSPAQEIPIPSTTIYALGTADTVINLETLAGAEAMGADKVVIEVVETSAGGTYIRYDLTGSFPFADRAQHKMLGEGDVLKLNNLDQIKAFWFSDENAFTDGYVTFTFYRTV